MSNFGLFVLLLALVIALFWLLPWWLVLMIFAGWGMVVAGYKPPKNRDPFEW